jgi:hypothetical protein
MHTDDTGSGNFEFRILNFEFRDARLYACENPANLCCPRAKLENQISQKDFKDFKVLQRGH